MCKYKLIAVTNRKIYTVDILERIKQMAESGIETILLREKDLCEEDYEELAEKVLKICRKYNTDCILHTYTEVAKRLGCSKIHLSFKDLQKNKELLNHFSSVGASVHSLEEAMQAEDLYATYLIAGHIFATDCKKNLPPRGLPFLSQICAAVKIPVYAIGGISADKIPLVMEAGASGVCMMSGLGTGTFQLGTVPL